MAVAKTMHPDDWAAGIYVAVRGPISREIPQAGPLSVMPVGTVTSVDRSMVETVFNVIKSCYPLAILAPINPRGTWDKSRNVNVSERDWIRVPSEYATKLCPRDDS